MGSCVDQMPDYLPMILQSRVTLSEYPEGKADIFPPMYIKGQIVPQSSLLSSIPTTPRVHPAPQNQHDVPEQTPEQATINDKVVPIISLGRYGAVMRRHKPADDAIVAMLDSVKYNVKLALQDL